MKVYFLRRLLLVPVTLLGITMLVFILMRAAPGGPVQRDLREMNNAAAGEQGGTSGMRESEGAAITPIQLFEIEERHRREKGTWRSYLEWLGVVPRDLQRTARSFNEEETKVSIQIPGMNMDADIVKKEDGSVELRPSDDLSDVQKAIVTDRIDEYDWKARVVGVAELRKRWKRNSGG
ncbi:MAG TPA: hypothetical protein DD438_11225, partial [Verrucomicrobiales bacterium]|nr:hypothetical protein [Verrucomicrobiales bacterium]